MDLRGASAYGCERVGNTESAIVVGVNADGTLQIGDHLAGDATYFLWQCTSIRITKYENVSAGIARGAEGLKRVFGLSL